MEANFTPSKCRDPVCRDNSSHMHCPFCAKTEIYHDTKILEAHYYVKHVDKGIDFAGLKILRCSDHCDIIGLIKGEKKFRGAHWHCYKCKNGFNRRNEAIKHYKTHFRHPGTTFQINISQNVARTDDINFSSETTTAEKSLLLSMNGLSAIILNGQGIGDSEGTCAMTNVSESSGEVETAAIMIIEEDPYGVSSVVNTEEIEDNIYEDLKLNLKAHIKKLKDKEILEKALEEEIRELKAQLLTHKKELEKAHQREEKLLKQLNKSVNTKQEELPLSFQNQPFERSQQQIIQFQIQKQSVQSPALILDAHSGFLSQTVPVPVSVTAEPTLKPYMVTSSTTTSTHQSLPSFSENSLTLKDSDFLSLMSRKSSNQLNKAPLIVTVSQVNRVPKINSTSSSGTDNLLSYTGGLGQPISMVSIPVLTSVQKGSQILSECNLASTQKTTLSPSVICSVPSNQVPGTHLGLKGMPSCFTFMHAVPAGIDLASIPSQNSHINSVSSSVSSMSKAYNVGESPSNYYLVQTNPISSGTPYVSSDVSKYMTLSSSSLPITKLYECERISDGLMLAQRSPDNLNMSNISPVVAHTVSVSAFPSFTTKAREHAKNSSDNLVVHVVPVTSSNPENTHSVFTTRGSELPKEALPSFCIPATTERLVKPLSKGSATTGKNAGLTLLEMMESSALEESSVSTVLCASPVVVECTLPSSSSTLCARKRMLNLVNTQNKRIK
ncbi:uncharacterized protein LOC143244276 isoform X2 [Tachypleus tridentatus]